ncbi:MAG: enoyl-CoA hydratase-related protein, partial [Solirubrobacteraceae bacterium]|nr:enoyl-CoA hydratase-related protein [Solirubrobacteraceae bacterium]
MSENSSITWDQGDDGIVVLTLDAPGQSANTMNAGYVDSMESTLDRLEAEKESITGVVITSAKKTFFAGGDLNLLRAVRPEDAAQFDEGMTHVKAQLRRLETLGRPVVSAINGAALGGGLELTLATHHRIAVDDARVKLGLPEVQLGLLPGAGGVTRTVRMLGIADIFEALTAHDRPYKSGMKLSKALEIMVRFNKNGHIDPDLFDVFMKKKVYRQY